MAKTPLFAAQTAYLEVTVKQAWTLKLKGPLATYSFLCKKCGKPVEPVEHSEHGDHFRHVVASECLGRF